MGVSTKFERGLWFQLNVLRPSSDPTDSEMHNLRAEGRILLGGKPQREGFIFHRAIVQGGISKQAVAGLHTLLRVEGKEDSVEVHF
jgi:hypothetical protein